MKLKRVRGKSARIEMLPLIDIVFLLLVFFIYAMLSMVVHNGLHLKLPESTSAERSEEAPSSLFIKKREGQLVIHVDDSVVSLDNLTNYYLGNHVDAERKKVMVFAEENISYQELFQILDQLKIAGVSSILLQANRK